MRFTKRKKGRRGPGVPRRRRSHWRTLATASAEPTVASSVRKQGRTVSKPSMRPVASEIRGLVETHTVS